MSSTKSNAVNKEILSRYSITRFDRIMLGYGAICGFLLVLYASGNPVLAFILGVPPGIFGIGFPMLIHKRFASPDSRFAALSIQKKRRIGSNVAFVLAAMLAYRAFAGDWFAFGCTFMLAGTFVLFFANEFDYFT